MKQFGSSSRLRCAGIVCIFLILATQLLPFLGNYWEEKDSRRNNTHNLAGTPLTEAPPALTRAAMTYDSESDRIILFGGSYNESGLSNETWSYDYNTNTWINMTPSISPPARAGHHMVYDSQSDLCIMFGGLERVFPFPSGGVPEFDLWTYDLNSNTWTEMFPLSFPDRYSGHDMVYDSGADLVLLFIVDELWTYDVDTNTLENITVIGQPSERRSPKMTYDENSGLTLLYGGSGGGAVIELRETWVYNSTSNAWAEMHPDRNPAGSAYGSVTFDSQADEMILFTADSVIAGVGTSETWTYSFERDEWRKKLTPISPSPRRRACMAYDSESNRTILFSGSNGFADTWAYSHGNNSWINMAWKPDDGTFCFVAYGDTHGSVYDAVAPIHTDIVNLYIQHDPKFIIHTGDMVNAGGESYQWNEFNESIANLNALGIPLYGAPGDHDQLTHSLNSSDYSLSPYQDFFNYSCWLNQPEETELHYSFDANGIHFVFLNTVEGWIEDKYTSSAPQIEWLEQDLALYHKFIVVTFHHPAWSINVENPSTRWEQVESIRETYHTIFMRYGVDLVFNGHDNLYHRTIRNEICYVVTGGGGAPLAELQNESGVRQSGDIGFSEYHYCVAKVVNKTLNVEVFLLNGTIADTFSLELPMPPDAALVMITSSATVIAAIVIVILIIRKEEEL